MGRNHLENHEGTIIGHTAGNHSLHVRTTALLHCGSNINLRLLSLLLTHVRRGMRNRNQRSTHALTELVLDQRVRLIRGAIGGIVGSIRQAQTHLQHRSGNRQQRQRTHHQGQQRTRQHKAQPAVRLLGALGILHATFHNFLRGINGSPQLLRHDLSTSQRQHRGGKSHRNQGGNNHAERGSITHHTQERNTGHVQRHECNNHGARRKNHSITTRAVRQGNRPVLRHTVEQVRAIAVQDEQGIVDTNRQAEHQAQSVGGGTHLNERRKGECTQHTHPHAHQGHQDGQTGSHEGTKHNHLNNKGDDHARHLAGVRPAAKCRFAQVRVKLDGRPVQVRRLNIRHNLLQVS